MATSGSTSCASIPTIVPEGFHYETKYIVLNYLGMLPIGGSEATTDQGDATNEKERARMMKEQIAEELRQLEEEISASSASTGFDRLTSPVFSPAKPESSVEDCLAAVGDTVAQELGTHLAAAVQTLLTGPLDYQRFRSTALDLSAHTQGGWSKVLVPLVLLQALQSKGQPLATLLDLGLRCLEEEEADYIIQQGGWSEIFNLVPEEERGVTIAEDSNDIYILSGEQHPEQPSPPSSLLCTGSVGEQSSWQTESLPVSLAGHESWAQVGAMDPEDVKSLDSNEGAALAEERSENNSSNSDIVHVEREEAELLEEGGEAGSIEESMMSVLGTESELAELRAEFGDQIPAPAGAESTPPASLISLEEPVVIETPASLSAAPSLISSEPELLPPVPEPAAPSPVPAEKAEPEPAAAPPVPAEGPPPPVATDLPAASAQPDASSEPDQHTKPVTAAPQPQPEAGAEPVATVMEPPAAPVEEPVFIIVEAPVEEEAPPAPVDPPVTEAPVVPVEAPVEEAPVEVPVTEAPVDPVETPAKKPEPAEELPVLLYGGAALVLLVAVVYSIISFRRR